MKILVQFDILLIQEVQDKSEKSLYSLLAAVNDEVKGDGDTAGHFRLICSPRLGRSDSKEQYAFFYRLTAECIFVLSISPSELRELTCWTAMCFLTRPKTPSSENLSL